MQDCMTAVQCQPTVEAATYPDARSYDSSPKDGGCPARVVGLKSQGRHNVDDAMPADANAPSRAFSRYSIMISGGSPTLAVERADLATSGWKMSGIVVQEGSLSDSHLQ